MACFDVYTEEGVDVRLERLSKFCERLNAEWARQTRSAGVEDKRRKKSESSSKHTLKVYKLLQEKALG